MLTIARELASLAAIFAFIAMVGLWAGVLGGSI